MRTIYSSSGSNVTTSAQAYLQTLTGTLQVYDLYTIAMSNPWSSSAVSYYCYTSADFPITISTVQTGPNQLTAINNTWIQNAIERGNLEYSIGLNVTSFEWTWYPDDTILIPGNSHYTWKKAALSGLLDGCTFFLHRALCQPGANNFPVLIGTALMWKGLIQEVEVKAEYIKMTVPSMMQAFQDVQVPTQVVQPGQRIAPYLPTGAATASIGGLNAAASTPFDLHFAPGFADHALRDGFLTTFTGSPASSTSRPSGVRILDTINSGGVFHVFVADPVDPFAIPLPCKVYLPENIGSTLIPGAAGFPHIPPPEGAI